MWERANGARGLSTGLLTVEPGRSTAPYNRPDNEVLILLEGEAAIDVEGRRYRLGTLDHAAIPASLSRRIVNLSADRPATFHVSVASSSPTHTKAELSTSPVRAVRPSHGTFRRRADRPE